MSMQNLFLRRVYVFFKMIGYLQYDMMIFIIFPALSKHSIY